MKHIFEYEDFSLSDLDDLDDLANSLDNLGLVKKRSYALWVTLPRFMSSIGYTIKPNVLVALGTFWSSGTLQGDMDHILNSIRRGDFTRPDQAGMDWKTLGGFPIGTYSPEDPESRRWAKDTIKFLDLPSLKTFLGVSRGPLGKTLDSLREEILERLHPESREMINSGVVLVYGNSGDDDLLIPPVGSLYQASIGGERVIIEDLTTKESKNPRIYLRQLL